MQAEIGGAWPRGTAGAPGAGRGRKDLFGPSNTLISDFQPPKPWESLSDFLSQPVYSPSLQQPQETNTNLLGSGWHSDRCHKNATFIFSVLVNDCHLPTLCWAFWNSFYSSPLCSQWPHCTDEETETERLKHLDRLLPRGSRRAWFTFDGRPGPAQMACPFRPQTACWAKQPPWVSHQMTGHRQDPAWIPWQPLRAPGASGSWPPVSFQSCRVDAEGPSSAPGSAWLPWLAVRLPGWSKGSVPPAALLK